jgi:methylamine utilization protein MauE
VFLVAGVTKAVDRSVPVLPWLEIALGGLLVARLALPWTAWAAAGLLGGFTVWLLTHRGVPCACFGAWSRRPAGWGAVARNIALMILLAPAVR